MTRRQEKILEAGLELFTSEGFASTPTSKIAKRASVSEGLIFRHFGNKKGLLDTLMKEAESLQIELLGPILFETNPKKIIRRVIKMPFKTTGKKDLRLWKLLFIQKWEPGYNNPDKLKPLIDKLAVAFKELKYKDPEHEAILLNHITESIFNEILKGNMKQENSFRDFLLKKYKV